MNGGFETKAKAWVAELEKDLVAAKAHAKDADQSHSDAGRVASRAREEVRRIEVAIADLKSDGRGPGIPV